ncbi:BMP family ABC transporter substrate-binding protein [Lactobacillus sp. ESL0681]|uniref:BMP family lipoprotein n=1 Tax=Lactobacillus sp. ESL0681 TaxID=2983211 RepID=UPI0023F96854|nr:BMP family ABC transporter substrate-binding protein [Lactobacillus sp. ESL0681]WEV41162.1 BMP family ABC transporter substrate-binding protein [Lactobacillus sp. ESL0681]
MKVKFKKLLAVSALTLATGLVLGACSGKKQGGSGNSSSSAKHSIALVTTTTGVNDNSFNQSAWNGFKAYGKEHNLKRGKNGYQYFQSSSDADFEPNFAQAAKAGYQTIFGIGYNLKDAVSAAAKKNPKKNYVIVDEVIKNQKNVASANFKSEQAAYLAGVVAATQTKTNKIGFIGGVRGNIIDLFDAGFTKGVNDQAKKMHKKVTIMNQYAGNFTSVDKGKAIAQSMYAKGADIIFHAAGPVGNGLFQEAKSLNQTRPESKRVWAIGVDVDQSYLGKYKTKSGKQENCILTSVITGVNIAAQDIANRAYAGKFPGGKNLIYGLKDDGVAITRGQISAAAWKNSRTARSKILNGEIKVPIHPEK